MGLEIVGGGNGKTVHVTRDNKLQTAAEVNTSSYYASLENGFVFGTTSHIASAAAGAHVFYFKNTSTTKDFIVEIIRCGAVNAALWKVFTCTGTAAGGSAITPTNYNISKGIAAEATARGDGTITGLTTVAQLTCLRAAAGTDKDLPVADTMILGTNNAIVVEYDTGTTGIGEVFMRGYYRER